MPDESFLPVRRGMFVRLTTNRFSDQGMPAGSEGVTLYRDDGDRWHVSFRDGYVDLGESEFEVIGTLLQSRGVVLPSLNGGWLSIQPLSELVFLRSLERTHAPVEELWGRYPDSSDFLGRLAFAAAEGAVGFPVLWDRARQLKLVNFLGTPDHMTHTFPQVLKLNWPDPALEIGGVVTVDRDRTLGKAAELDVTMRNRKGHTVSARLLVPATACKQASESLVDLFPSVSSDDLDYG
jgi:hypothetical protein